MTSTNNGNGKSKDNSKKEQGKSRSLRDDNQKSNGNDEGKSED